VSNKVVIFGPWVGEFSFEISWWMPEIRLLRNTKYKDYHAIHVGYLGRKGLYKDFIDEYIPFDDEINNEIKFWMPDCYLVRDEKDSRSGINMPVSVGVLFEDIKLELEEKYDVVEVVTPLDNPIIGDRCREENPIGEYKHLSVNPTVDEKVKKDLQVFDNDRDTVCVMARSRTRFGEVDGETWNPDNWGLFVYKLVNELNVNVVMMGIPEQRNYPGSLAFEDSEYIKSFVFEGEDSIDYQISLLKNTKCSIYGASGAVTLTFFTDTPVFTQQSKENGNRLNFKWQKSLTNSHKSVKLFDKYSMGELYDSPVQELFDEFKEFYKGLDNE